jgi:hypothetical protein
LPKIACNAQWYFNEAETWLETGCALLKVD